jgi:predicted HicB family RNase H-like nuclease
VLQVFQLAQSTTPKQDNTEHIHVRCSQELKRGARVEAARNDQTLSDYVRDLIRGDIND